MGAMGRPRCRDARRNCGEVMCEGERIWKHLWGRSVCQGAWGFVER